WRGLVGQSLIQTRRNGDDPAGQDERTGRRPGSRPGPCYPARVTASEGGRAGSGKRGGSGRDGMSGNPGTIGQAEGGRGVPDPIRVLIVDDHALFRRGLEMVLTEEPDIELVGEASDGAEAVEKAGEALPDVVLMDIRMPKSSGIEACRAMKEVAPSAK